MGRLRTLLALVALLAGGAATAAPLSQVFAGCTGRLSAEVEHAWLVASPDIPHLEARRARFEALLAAVARPDTRAALMGLRINAKHAHAQILGISYFSPDAARARWARRRAAAEIGYCDSLLLQG